MKLSEVWKQDPRFAWLPEQAESIFNGCFNMEAEELSPGESRKNEGRAGYLVSGRGRLEDGVEAVSGSLFGVRNSNRGKESQSVVFCAEEPCVVLWFDFELFTSVCYRACWFHVKLIGELEQLLD